MNEIRLAHGDLKAIVMALTPEPNEEYVTLILNRERAANPHGDSYKPVRRSVSEIKFDERERMANKILERCGRI